jgi:two-component system sensor histidine kinase KdpD
MGGTLIAEDTPGGGLTMVVSLEAAAVPAAPPAPLPTP